MVAPQVAQTMPPDGPVEWLAPVPIRQWPKVLGALFFVWALTATCLSTVLFSILSFVVMPFDRGGTRVWWVTRSWSQTVMWISGGTVAVAFERPLPTTPVIFVCNHQSAFDILALFLGLGRRFVFIAKKSVFRYPFLGWHIKAAGYISVDRGDREASIRSLEAAGAKIRNGVSVTVFPEGTRSKDGSILPFKKGPFMVALKAGVPLVPVAIEGSLQLNPKRRWYVCPNTIRILVGPPIATAGLLEADRDALMERVRRNVLRLHRRLGGLGGDETNHIAAAGLEGIGRAVDGEVRS